MKHLPPLICLIALSACATSASHRVESSGSLDPQADFFSSISKLCGRAYRGTLASDTPSDAGFEGAVMHVRSCSEMEIRIPLHAGNDRSRTWVLHKTGTGLSLKHDHRHEDGSADRLNNYGGETTNRGTPMRQEFPADFYSQVLFTQEDLIPSNENVWAIEVTDRIFAYELSRPDRFFRLEFDLSAPVATPPPPWGAEAANVP